jgi:cytochrome c553
LRTETSAAGALRGALAVAVLVAAAALAGCRQDMHQAPRYDPLEQSDFFADQRASRPLVEGTVARGQLRADKVLYTGKGPDGAFVARMPMPVTRALLERGQDRFNIYCSPCHAATGEGNGMIVQRGLKQPPSFHIDRLRQERDGYFYDVMTNGFGVMQDYAAQLKPEDRWAVVAYLRALQFSRRATVADVPEAERPSLDNPAAAAAPQGTTGHE